MQISDSPSDAPVLAAYRADSGDLIQQMAATNEPYSVHPLAGKSPFWYSAYRRYRAPLFAASSRSAPQYARGTVRSADRIELSWTAPYGSTYGYIVQRSAPGANVKTIATLPAYVTRFNDTGLTEATTYTYHILAFNAAAVSEAATVTLTTPLASPTFLRARASANAPRINLTWIDNSQSEAGYIIERSQDGAHFVEIARVEPDVTSFRDTRLHADTTYTYRIRAFGPADSLPATATARTTHFRVFDDTHFLNKPDLSSHGIQDLYVAAGSFMWKLDDPAGGYDWTTPNEAATRQVARKVADLGQVLVIDIEHWPYDIRRATEDQVRSTIDKLSQIVDWIRDERPEVKLGFYGIGPIRDYWTPVLYRKAIESPGDPWYQANLPEFTAKYQQWQVANDYLKPLMDKVDLLFPSLYTFYNDPENWVRYAKENILEAYRYGKPVIPFIWMDFHNSTSLLGQDLSGEFWRVQLQTIRALADGVVIWGGVHFQPGAQPRNERWDEQAPWWVATREFLESA